MNTGSALSSPLLETFLAQGLATNTSVLALGDDHVHGKHLDALQAQMPQLVQEQGLSTLAVDYPAFVNLFFWAYADHKMAQGDLRDLLCQVSPSKEPGYANRMADLVIAAMDQGVRAVAYDTHATYAQLADAQTAEVQDAVKEWLERDTPQLMKEKTLPDSKEDLRSKEEKLWAAKVTPPRSVYKKRLDLMDGVINSCQQRGIGVDASGAALLAHFALPGSCLTLGHVSRIDGVGQAGAHGTFVEHFKEAMCTRGTDITVTKAVLGSSALIEAVEQRQQEMRTQYRGKVLAQTSVGTFDIDTGTAGHLPVLLQKAVGLEEKVAGRAGLFANKAKRAAQVDPLTVKEIDVLAAMMTDGMGNGREVPEFKGKRFTEEELEETTRHYPALKPAPHVHVPAELMRRGVEKGRYTLGSASDSGKGGRLS